MNNRPSKYDINTMSMTRRSWAWAISRAVLPGQRRNRVLADVAAQVAMGKPSFHTSMGSTVAAILSFLEEQGIPYTLAAEPGKGYVIKAHPPETPLMTMAEERLTETPE